MSAQHPRLVELTKPMRHATVGPLRAGTQALLMDTAHGTVPGLWRVRYTYGGQHVYGVAESRYFRFVEKR